METDGAGTRLYTKPCSCSSDTSDSSKIPYNLPSEQIWKRRALQEIFQMHAKKRAVENALDEGISRKTLADPHRRFYRIAKVYFGKTAKP